MNIELDQGGITDAREAMDLACLDHEDVSRPGLELLAVHRISPAALADELDLVIRMSMRTGSAAGLAVEEKDGDSHIPLIGSNEVVRAPAKWQIFLANAMHVRLRSNRGEP